MAWTALDTVTDALLLCGAYSPGEAPSAPVGQIGLSFLNQIRASLNAKGMTCYGASTIALTADGGPSYTLGTGGDNATRPVGVMSVQYESGGSIYQLQEAPFAQYQAYFDKATSGTPGAYALDGAFPLLGLYIYQPPTTGTIRVVMRTPFSEIANLSDAMPDPPEYREYFRYALAEALATIPGLGTGEPSGFVSNRAATLLSDLQTASVAHNIPAKFMPYAYRRGCPDGEYRGGF